MPTDAERREKALRLVRALRYGALPDEQASEKLAELERVVPNPEWLTLLFHTMPDLTDEEAVDAAMRYRPFAM